MAAIGTRLLKVEIDGVEYSAELANARFTAEDSEGDTITFADAAAGGAKDWSIAFTAVQDAAAGSIWSEIFDNSGAEVPITFIPYGNEAPTTTEPHFTQTAVIAQFDGDFLGGDADASPTAKMTFESSWKLKGKPVKVTGA